MKGAIPYWIWFLIGLAAALFIVPARAADKADKSGKDQTQMRRLQQQLRVTEQEKVKLAQQLTQQKAEAENQLKEAQSRAIDARRRSETMSGRNGTLSKEVEAIKARHDAIKAEFEALAAASKTEHAALSAKLADTERRLAEQRSAFEAEKQQFETVTAQNKNTLSGCQARNDSLYKLGNELLDRYEKKSCVTAVLQAEPFTGLKRAQVEKVIEEYREKLDKDQRRPATGAQTATPAR
jgi:chromosome segregation ATPase